MLLISCDLTIAQTGSGYIQYIVHTCNTVHLLLTDNGLLNNSNKLLFIDKSNFRTPMPKSKKEFHDEFFLVFNSVELFKDFIS